MTALQERTPLEISGLLDDTSLRNSLSDSASRTEALKKSVEQINEGLRASYESGTPVEQIVYGRAELIDRVLSSLFDAVFADIPTSISLVAVGGYGRGELHPGSDIDLMLLLKSPDDEDVNSRIEQFLMNLWDSRLEIGHSVRTVDECIDESIKDITVATNIMESRLIAGADDMFDVMKHLTSTDATWTSQDYFQAKLEEQLHRNGKYNDTSYNLEPNIKESRGGLRDIQMIGWVAKRHFGADTLNDLVEHGFLRQDEYDALMAGQRLLWKIRCSLHYLAGRREDRMLFDYQRSLAMEFGYEDDPEQMIPNMAIENFMQTYFRTVMELERLNELLLQLFREAILYGDQRDEITIIDQDFQLRNNYIEARSEDTFRNNPSALLGLFLTIQQIHEIQGVRAETIRLIRDGVELIDDEFRSKDVNKRLFIRLMSSHRGITHELRRMNRYGILAAYIPGFASIVGRMQYDLFHAYTVDQHTLFVIRNLRRLSVPEFCHEYPLASGVFQHIRKPELIYLAGLFHDIAKGRNGDHSALGAVDALEFCLSHGLDEEDAQLVSWLVRNHLIMSMTAQRRDISDPAVINEFADHVGSLEHLDYLYLLTISDIRGTNPAQWNSWKDKLFIELYSKTADLLNRDEHTRADEQETIKFNRTRALRKLDNSGLHTNQAEDIWEHFSDSYFLRHTAGEVSWHTQEIFRHDFVSALVDVRADDSTNSLELLVYMQTRPNIFLHVATTLSQMNLNVVKAHVMRCSNDYSLETFRVISAYEDTSQLSMLADEVKQRLTGLLNDDAEISNMNWGTTRQQKHFEVETEVTFTDSPNGEHSRLLVTTADRQGVLAIIAGVFVEHGISIYDAFIATAGEKALDYFDITDDATDQPLDESRQKQLRDALLEEL